MHRTTVRSIAGDPMDLPVKVLLDVDGVLADFDRAMCEAHGHTSDYQWSLPDSAGRWDVHNVLGMDFAEWWRPANNRDFWANIPKTAEHDELIAMLESTFGAEHISLLTTPSQHHGSVLGKLMWIEEHLPDYTRRLLIGPCKEFCAAPNHLLVDDADHNIDACEHAGGLTIQVPRPWNRLHNVAYSPLEYIQESLDVIERHTARYASY